MLNITYGIKKSEMNRKNAAKIKWPAGVGLIMLDWNKKMMILWDVLASEQFVWLLRSEEEYHVQCVLIYVFSLNKAYLKGK